MKTALISLCLCITLFISSTSLAYSALGNVAYFEVSQLKDQVTNLEKRIEELEKKLETVTKCHQLK